MRLNLKPTSRDPLPTAATTTSRSSGTSLGSFFDCLGGRSLLLAPVRMIPRGVGSTVPHQGVILFIKIVPLLSHGVGERWLTKMMCVRPSREGRKQVG